MTRYELGYDDEWPPEFVDAMTPSEAVAQRKRKVRLPSRITDLTAIAAWIRRMRDRRSAFDAFLHTKWDEAGRWDDL